MRRQCQFTVKRSAVPPKCVVRSVTTTTAAAASAATTAVAAAASATTTTVCNCDPNSNDYSYNNEDDLKRFWWPRSSRCC